MAGQARDLRVVAGVRASDHHGSCLPWSTPPYWRRLLANPPSDALDDFSADDRALDPANWSQAL
jgi:hypothetical protein